MIDFPIPQIAQELRLAQGQVAATVSLLDDGATVPFIARYRKENTASLDEVAITNIRDRLSQIRELRDRREAILDSLEKRGMLTEELRLAIMTAEILTTLEDIYLPYRPKRRTRATIAKVLATSKSGTLWLRRDQGDMAVLLESPSRWL